MMNLNQIKALANDTARASRALCDALGTRNGDIKRVEQNLHLSPAGKAIKIADIDAKANVLIDSARQWFNENVAKLAAEERAWSDPLAVMLMPDPEVKDPGTHAAEAIVFGQRLASAEPSRRQMLLQSAVDADRWDLVAAALLTKDAASAKAGFVGLSDADIREKFPVWREGRAQLGMARVAVEEANFFQAQAAGPVSGLNQLKFAHRIGAAARQENTAPPTAS